MNNFTVPELSERTARLETPPQSHSGASSEAGSEGGHVTHLWGRSDRGQKEEQRLGQAALSRTNILGWQAVGWRRFDPLCC